MNEDIDIDVEDDIYGEDDESRVICPICNQVVLDYETSENNPCEHVMLIYTDALNDEFVYESEEMTDVANEMIAEYEKRDGDDSLDILMEEYASNRADIMILEMTTSGMACGPCSNTDYIMFKLEK